MRVVFMGTPRLAATVLREIRAHVQVVAAYTRPDAIRGRGKGLVPSPVKEEARRAGIPVLTPKTLRDERVVSELRAFDPDVICVAAYGVILPGSVLGIPRHGCLNVHSSLLPRWRGAAPIERCILAGDAETGVCIMRMEEGLDTGPYCMRASLPTGTLNVEELSDKLALCGARLLAESLGRLESDGLTWTEQAQDGVVYAHKIEKGELDAHPDESALSIWRKVRASSAAHPSKAVVAGKALTLEDVRVPDGSALPPSMGMPERGQVAFCAKRLFLGTPDGALEVLRVKPDGKKSMDAPSFASGIQGIKRQVLTWGRA